MLDRVVTRENGNGDTLAYTYDPLGRTLTVRDDSVTGTVRAQWQYDQTPDTQNHAVLGALTSATRYVDGFAYTSTVARYDLAGRPLETTVTLPQDDAFDALGAHSFSTKTTYTTGGQMESVTLPAITTAEGTRVLGAETVTTRYDSTDLPSWMSGGFGWGVYVARSTYDAQGRPVAVDMGNTFGAFASSQYESGTDRLLELRVDREGHTTPIVDLHYSYDAMGNVLSLKDTPTGTNSSNDNQCFGYDGLRRLDLAWSAATGNCAVAKSAIVKANVGGAAPFWNEYGYDLVGNRTSLIQHAVGGQTSDTVTSYANITSAAHQLSSTLTSTGGTSTSRTYSYDDAGNRESTTFNCVTTSYEWDAEGELAAVGDDRNIYDASGSRLVRTQDDDVTVYLPGGQEINISGETVTATRYYSFGGATVAVRTGSGLGGVSSLVTDHQGSVIASIPNTEWGANDFARTHTDPFGAARGGGGSGIPGDHRFLGAVRDLGSGLSLLGARFCDDQIGRFISVDPVIDTGVPAQFNAYSYSWNNPVTFGDPTGARPDPTGNGPGSLPGVPTTSSKPTQTKSTSFWNHINDPYPEKLQANLDLAVNSIANFVNAAGEFVVDNFKMSPVCFGIMMAVDPESYWKEKTDTAMGIATAVQSPGATFDAMMSDLGNTWDKDPGVIIGQGLFAGVSLIGGGAGVAKLGASAVKGITKAGSAAAKLETTAAKLCSFGGATLVLMADGTKKAINTIAVGDLVVASDPETGEQEAKPVQQVFVHKDSLFDLVVDGETITTTEDHPFWSVTDARFERADQLDEGESILSASGESTEIDVPIGGSGGTGLAYNLSIEGIHTYHVGQKQVLVHNSCPLPGPLPAGYTSFSAAKRDLGSPGIGNVFDHVVEQSQIVRSGFPATDVHSPFNLNPVPAWANQMKANLYSSRFDPGKPGTVRDWLSGQPFSVQYNFGMEAMAKILKEGP